MGHAQIYAELMELYRDPPCPLDHQNHFQLLTSVILSAQVQRLVTSPLCSIHLPNRVPQRDITIALLRLTVFLDRAVHGQEGERDNPAPL